MCVYILKKIYLNQILCKDATFLPYNKHFYKEKKKNRFFFY